jgi:hypothetical protein
MIRPFIAAGALANLTEPVGRVGLGLRFEPMDELGLRLLRRDAGQHLETATLLPHQLVELLLSLGDRFLLPTQLAGAAANVLLPLFEDVEFAVEHRLAILNALLFALDFLTSPARFDLPVLAELDQLFLPRDQRALAEGFRFALGLTDDALRRLFGRRLRQRLGLPFGNPATAPAKKEKGHGGDDKQYAKRSTQCRSIHVVSMLHPDRRRGDEGNHCAL